MPENASSLPPPVPPRRKKSKAAPRRPNTTYPHPDQRPERKARPAPPLPPPAAPQRSRISRKTPSPFPSEKLSPAIIKYSSPECSPKTVCHDKSRRSCIFEGVDQLETTQVPPRKAPVDRLAAEEPVRSRPTSPFSKSPEPNKYPPLYFTYQDYQTVMEDSLNPKDDTIDDEEVEKETEAKVEQSTEPEVPPFFENVTFENEREEIYFRVTTTDRPFEKCLGDWNKPYEADVEEFKEEQHTDHYIFEDYMDRSKRINARPHLLFSENFFTMSQEETSLSTEKSTMRVRFVIESPSTSTPDMDLDDDTTSYGELVGKQFETRGKSSVQLVEVTDEEMKRMDENISISNEVESELDSTYKFESMTMEDENISESLCVVTTNQLNDTYSDLEEDVEEFAVAICIDSEPTINISSEENIEISESRETVNENTSLNNENNESERGLEKVNMDPGSKEICEKKKIFIDSLNYDLSTEDSSEFQNKLGATVDNVERDENLCPCIPQIVEITESCDEVTENEEIPTQILTENFLENKTESNVGVALEEVPAMETSIEQKSVPVSARRNCFLETMLADDNLSQSSWALASINCEVIAAHPKQESSAPLKQEQQQSPKKPDVVAAATEVAKEMAPRNEFGIKSTETGSRPKARGRINASASNNKSAGEIKGDVLNELLTNFDAIKLRPVNTNTCEPPALAEDAGERRRSYITTTVEQAKTDETCGMRQAQVSTAESASKFATSKMELSTKSLTTEMENSSEKSESVADFSSKDRCAIVEEAPQAQRNDNDNKAMTPVVVSKDQFREAVSITPGSVRSFVKYYEIHSEISSISKLKDNAFKRQKHELARENDKAKHVDKLTKTGEKSKKASKNSTTPKTGITSKKMQERVIDRSSSSSSSMTVCQNVATSSSSPTQFMQKQSCMKNAIPSPRSERRKSVQFDSECTVINPGKKDEKKEKDEEEGTFSSFIGGIRTRLKRKAPVKPDVKKPELQQKGLKLDQRRTESAAIICIQKSPESKAMTCTAKPGNRSFLPKTETLQNNQTIVFYCTV